MSEDREREFITATLVSSANSRIRDPNPSPDGLWVAEVIRYDCTPTRVINHYLNAFEILQIRQAQANETRIIDTQLQFCGGLGAAGLSSGSWSPNGRYLYFTRAASGIPEGCGWWIPPLKRLDVSTWSVEYLGSGPTSPDGHMRATWQDHTLLISSVEQGDIARLAPLAPDMIQGQIAWSPANSALVYLETELDCYPWGTTHLVYVDLSTYSSRVVLDSDAPSFPWVEWREPHRILLRDQDDNPWTYDLTTESLTRLE